MMNTPHQFNSTFDLLKNKNTITFNISGSKYVNKVIAPFFDMDFQ